MKERIRELAEQALQLVADEHTGGDESRLNTDSYHVKDLIQEKFAELIVQECVQTLRNRYMGDNNREDMEVRRCIEDVKKHFGVK